MKPPFENLRGGWSRRGAWFALPALALVLSTAGVVMVPAKALVGAEQELVRLQGRARECAAERLSQHAFQSSGGPEMLARTDGLLTGQVPQPSGEIELTTAVRLLAARFDLELAGLSLGAPAEGEAQVLSMIGQRTLELRGSASLSGWCGFVRGLRALGQPCAVDAFTFARSNTSEPRFDGRLELQLFHRATIAPEPAHGPTEKP